MITDHDRMIAFTVVKTMSDWNIQESIREYNEDPDTMDEHDYLLLAADLQEKEIRESEGRWNPVPPPQVDELFDEFPRIENEPPETYAQRLAMIGQSRGILRQCSLGWHDECSARRFGNTTCNCQCHADHVSVTLKDKDA
jgi:hypothetical protein